MSDKIVKNSEDRVKVRRRYCPTCGKPISSNAVVCVHCGKNLRECNDGYIKRIILSIGRFLIDFGTAIGFVAIGYLLYFGFKNLDVITDFLAIFDFNRDNAIVLIIIVCLILLCNFVLCMYLLYLFININDNLEKIARKRD